MKIVKRLLVLSILIAICVGCTGGEEIKEINLQPVQKIIYGKTAGNDHDIFGFVCCFNVDSKENLYVVDASYKEIRIYDKNGKLVQNKAYSGGEGSGKLDEPIDIDIDSSGMVYIIDKTKMLLNVYNEKLEFVTEIKLSFAPGSLTVINSENIFIAPFNRNGVNEFIHKFNLKNKDQVLKFFNKAQTNNAEKIEDGGEAPRLTKDSEGNIYISLFYPYVIRKYKTSGELVWEKNCVLSSFAPPLKITKNKRSLIFAQSGSRDICVIGDKILNAIFKADMENKTYDITFEMFNKNTGDYIGSSKLKDALKIDYYRFLKSDVSGNLYIDEITPYPRITKYALEIK